MGLPGFDGPLGPLQFYKSSKVTIALTILASCVFATTTGYDTAFINGINILPSYNETLKLTTATKSLNAAASFLGWAIVATFMGPVVDRVGRRTGVLISIVLKIIGVVFMTVAQNVAIDTAHKIPSLWLELYLYYLLRALIAAGVTYRTSQISGEWSWRLPCMLQAVFSLFCLVVLLFVPESPRWLAHKGRLQDALASIASTHSNGDQDDPATLIQHREIVDMLEWERSSGQKMTYAEVFRTPSSRRRLMLAVSMAVLAMSSGNNIVSYYLGDMLTKAGISNSQTQLQINIVLSAWCLIIACIGTYFMNIAGRKTMCLVSVGFMTAFLFLVGALTKVYGGGENTSGVYATVASVFLFQGSYAIGITPLTVLYPPEVLNYSIRSNGMAAWTFAITCGGLFSVFVWPFALAAIGWKTYMINAGWDAVQFAFVAYFWIETKGLTLEEINAKFDALHETDSYGTEGLSRSGMVLEGVAKTTSIDAASSVKLQKDGSKTATDNL
ncbi:hexose transporter [Colletotrichum chrysophilum]|uniref:Hexose transporter n=1 Tax=Colletotrichum chrysophilum TaxID=1836956 RepID=A0AAD9EL01_9PEZI|nr:hexose transporter [Colletotrichum chrysophilum]